jgi:hypothetical protein
VIDISTDDGVRAALKEIAAWDAASTAEGPAVSTLARTRVHHTAQRRTLLAVAAAAVLLVVAVVAVAGRGSQESGLPAGSWSAMAGFPLPARLAPTAVWAGDEMLVFGGFDRDGSRRVDGAAYSPSTNTWRTIADMPKGAGGPRAQPVPDQAVWTGSEVLAIIQGIDWQWDLASYDPNSDSWRALDENRYEQLPTDALRHLAGDAPIDSPRSMVAWRGKGAVYGWNSATQQVGWATYDVAAHEWSSFQGIPLSVDGYGIGGAAGSFALVGDRYFVQLSQGVQGDNGLGGLVIDLEASTERALRYPADVNVRTGYEMMIDSAGLAVGMSFTDGARPTAVRQALLLDPATATWTPTAVPPGPFDFNTSANRPTLLAVPNGHLLLGGLDGHIAAVADVSVGHWRSWRGLPVDPARVGHTMIWTGRQVIVWGGAAADPAGSVNLPAIPLSDGAVYEYQE